MRVPAAETRADEIDASAVCLVGLGLHSGHLTREAEFALARCKRIFFIHPSSAVADWIRSLDPDAVDLSTFYQYGERRIQIYREMSSQVLFQSQTLGPVALALYGHPLVLSSLSRMVLAGCRWLKRECIVLPGVSSIDSVIADLEIDPGEFGLQVHEATELILRDCAIDPRRGLLLLQPAQAGDVRHSKEASLAPLTLVADYLLRFYSDRHQVTLVRSASEPWMKGTTLSVSLAALPEYGAAFPSDFTLFVPPAQESVTAKESGTGLPT